jgi:hypothetical protein
MIANVETSSESLQVKLAYAQQKHFPEADPRILSLKYIPGRSNRLEAAGDPD